MSDPKDIKKIVKEGYAEALKKSASCCSAGSCCGGAGQAKDISREVGYSDNDMASVPEGANLGFGCGNPVAIASLKEGEVVLDLGSGAGFDAFLASAKVGRNGRVIGVDMTPDMVEKARSNARKGDYANVEFRLGEIENMPVDDNSIDVIISNCVINLSPEKGKVFKEAFRVLRPGGRLMVSDLVLVKDLPGPLKSSVTAYIGCVAGAVDKEEYISYIRKAGFEGIRIVSESAYPIDAIFKELKEAGDAVASLKIAAAKPV